MASRGLFLPSNEMKGTHTFAYLTQHVSIMEHLCSFILALCFLLGIVIVLGFQFLFQRQQNINSLLKFHHCHCLTNAEFCTSELNNLKQDQVHKVCALASLQHIHLDPPTYLHIISLPISNHITNFSLESEAHRQR